MSQKLDEFLKSKVKSGFENGLFAVRNAVAPHIYNEDMVMRTKKKVSNSLYAIGGITGFSVAAFTPFPKDESFRILETASKISQMTFGTISGLAGGLVGTSISNKIIDGKWKDGSGDENISLKGLIANIDKYLSEKRPDLYEKSELTVAAKVNDILNADIKKENQQKEKENQRNLKSQEKQLKKQQKLAENQKILEIQRNRRAERK